MQRRADRGVLELFEPCQGVIVEVIGVLVDLPTDSSLLIHLGSRLPLQRVAVDATRFTSRCLVVVDVRVASLVRLLGTSWHVDGARHPGHTIGVGGGNDAFLVHVADDPLFSQGEVNGQVLALIEADAPRGVVDRPMIVCAAIESQLVLCPTVRSGIHTLGCLCPVAAEVVEVPGMDKVGVFGKDGICHLVPDGMFAVVMHVRIGKSPNACHCTEVVIKGSVFCKYGRVSICFGLSNDFAIPCMKRTTWSISPSPRARVKPRKGSSAKTGAPYRKNAMTPMRASELP